MTKQFRGFNLWVPVTGASCGFVSSRRAITVANHEDLRFVGRKLIFLLVTRAIARLRLARRAHLWKDAEILILRHQLSVAVRTNPRVHAPS